MRREAAANRIQRTFRDPCRKSADLPAPPSPPLAGGGASGNRGADGPADDNKVLEQAIQEAAREAKKLEASGTRFLPGVEVAISRLKPACPRCVNRTLGARVAQVKQTGRCDSCGDTLGVGAIGLACKEPRCGMCCCMACVGSLFQACLRQELGAVEMEAFEQCNGLGQARGGHR